MVYELAKVRMPQRWSGKTRDWTLPEEVWLNPVNISKDDLRQQP
jgi:putative transposase